MNARLMQSYYRLASIPIHPYFEIRSTADELLITSHFALQITWWSKPTEDQRT